VTEEDEATCLRIAEAITDGSPVDWEALCATSPELHSKLERLRALEAVAIAHRLAAAAKSAAAPNAVRARNHEPPFTWGPLRVLEKLGEGGFGEVFRAQDPTLEREVALKLHRVDPGGSEGSARQWLDEARRLARVRHPNVLVVHGADIHDGRAGLWTDLLEGRTLEALVAEQGPMSVEDVAVIGVELCRALGAVHAAGLVHGDVKTSNVMREAVAVGDGGDSGSGRVVLMDFGAAHERSAADDTAPCFGTPLTSALEVVDGGAPTPASDLYSLGVLLYRLVTAQYPVVARSIPELRERMGRNDRPALSHSRPDLPTLFTATVEKALAQDPAARFGSAGDMERALDEVRKLLAEESSAPTRQRPGWLRAAGRASLVAGAIATVLVMVVALNLGGWRDRIRGTPGTGRIESLAILPLTNLSGDREQEFFADGMTDELITYLAPVRSLRVISRASAMHYKGTKKSLREIARELGVAAVVQGTVLRSGARVRVTAQLVDVRSDRLLWAQSYERDVTDVLAMQSELAQAIVRAIQANLMPQERVRLATAPPVNPDAYENYLRARSHGASFTPEGMFRAIEYLETAIRIDPHYALAYAEMGQDYFYLTQALDALPHVQGMTAAGAAARSALRIDDKLGEAYAVLGTVQLWYEWNSAAAEKSIRTAIDLNPGDPYAHMQYGFLLSATGKHEQAVREVRRAVELSPMDLTMRVALVEQYHFARQYGMALQEAWKMIELDSSFVRSYYELAWINEAQGRYAEAVVARQRILTLQGAPPAALESLQRDYRESGSAGYWRWLLKRSQEETPPGRVCEDCAWMHGRLGQFDEAFDILEASYRGRDGDLIFLSSSFYDPLRSDPRFQDLVRRVGLRVH